MVIVGVIIRLVLATMAPEHSLFEMAWQAMCNPMRDEEQPVLIVGLAYGKCQMQERGMTHELLTSGPSDRIHRICDWPGGT
jgi:hypothetical protein